MPGGRGGGGVVKMIRAPFTAVVAGPTEVGKSRWIHRLLSTPHSIEPEPKEIVYHYNSDWQPFFDSFPSHVKFIKGFQGFQPNTLHILDDLMSEFDSFGEELVDVFTVKRHHSNISCILVVHNIFPPSEAFRTASRNSQYFILFNQPRDRSQITRFASQMRPGQTHFFQDAYNDAVSRNFGYLLIDLHPQDTDENLRLSTNAFHDEQRIYYVPDEKKKRKPHHS